MYTQFPVVWDRSSHNYIMAKYIHCDICGEFLICNVVIDSFSFIIILTMSQLLSNDVTAYQIWP